LRSRTSRPRPNRASRRTTPPRTTIPPRTVAVTGGIGAGKSEALRAFARHGAATASADEIVHRLYRDPEIVEALVARWGERVLEDGEVSRPKVGEIVFADRAELEWLEGLLHPRTVEAQRRWREEQTAPLLVVEVPLLYETGAEKRFDAVVVITAPQETRSGRSTVADVAEREERLIPDEEKARRADFVYVNDGTLEELDEFVRGVMERLT
jgi:dephospho-CoA kinase